MLQKCCGCSSLVSGNNCRQCLWNRSENTRIKKHMSIIKLRYNKSVSVVQTQSQDELFRIFHARTRVENSLSCIINHFSHFFLFFHLRMCSRNLMETQGGRNDTRNNMHFVSARESVTISRIANESPQMMGVVHYDEISLFKTRSYVVNGRLYICIGHSAACVKEKKRRSSRECSNGLFLHSRVDR